MAAIVEKYVSPTGAGLHDGTSEANAWTLPEGAAAQTAVDRLNLKGVFPLSSDITFSAAASNPNQPGIRGYASTIGDGGHATLNMTGGGTDIFANGAGQRWENLTISSERTGHAIQCTRATCTFYDIIITNLNTVGFAGGINLQSTGCSVLGCHITSKGLSSSSNCIQGGSRSLIQHNTLITDWVGVDMDGFSTEMQLLANKIIGQTANASYGFRGPTSSFQQPMLLAYNTIHGFNNDGLELTRIDQVTLHSRIMIWNNLIYNCTNGITLRAAAINNGNAYIRRNAMGAITGNRYGNLGDIDIMDDVVLTGDPFIDAAALDFRLNLLSGAGALCRQAGIGAPA